MDRSNQLGAGRYRERPRQDRTGPEFRRPSLWMGSQEKSFIKEVWTVFNAGEKGQGLVEYALIMVLVFVVVMIMILVYGPAVGNIFSNIMANF